MMAWFGAVSMGLGVSWFIGALYWQSNGVNADWLNRYQEVALQYHNDRNYDIVLGTKIGLAVPAGNLSFSVIVFSICAMLCIATLAVRRKAYDAELGCKNRWPTAIFFGCLWLVYVSLSWLVAEGKIKSI